MLSSHLMVTHGGFLLYPAPHNAPDISYNASECANGKTSYFWREKHGAFLSSIEIVHHLCEMVSI